MSIPIIDLVCGTLHIWYDWRISFENSLYFL